MIAQMHPLDVQLDLSGAKATGGLLDLRSAEHEPGGESSERRGPPNRTASIFPAFGARDQAFALSLFPGRFARSSDRLCFLAGLALGRLLIGLATLHLAKNALPLHFLF